MGRGRPKAQLVSGVNINELPVCSYKQDCHACRRGKCIALTATDFSEAGCPFYRNAKENSNENQRCMYRLIRDGHNILIEKYREVYIDLGMLDIVDDFVRDGRKELEDNG